MLDDESNDSTTTTPEAEQAEAPKKAPRKRATRATAAPTFAEPGTADAPAAEPPAADPAEKAPAKKAVKKAATPRKRTPKAEAAPEAAPTEEPAAEEPEASPRRRTRAPAVVVTFQAPEPTEGAPAPRTRRRAGTAGAVSPAELLPEDGAATEAEAEVDAEDLEENIAGTAARRRRRGRRGRGGRGPVVDGVDDDEDTDEAPAEAAAEGDEDSDDEDSASATRRRRRRRRSGAGGGDSAEDDVPTVVHVREPRQRQRRDGGGEADEDGVRGISGSTRMAAKRVRRQEGRDSGRKRAAILTEAEFLARRESVDRQMVVRQKGDRTQIAVLEDGILVEHYVTRASATSYAGNVYVGKVQNVLPSMEAAFVDIGKGRNAVLYAGEVNWEGVSNGQRKIEQVLKSGQEVLVQVTKDPIGHKGARLTSQISLPGRYLVYVPEGSMTGISRKLPEPERNRLKSILKSVVPEGSGVIIRTAAEGASEEEIGKDVRRLQAQWEVIKEKAEKGGAPKLLHAEPDLVIKVVRDVFNEDFNGLVVQGESEWDTIREYVEFVAPDLAPRMKRHTGDTDVFAEHRVDEQLLKALDRKVYLPSGGSLVIDRTEAMVVIDVNTGKYVGKGGNLEETVTRNNLEAAEEIARQLRLRDLGGIIVVDFIDMVLESNRDLVVRRLVECLGRDRTKHQVAEVTSLGLVQMTRKRVGQGLLESFSEPCDHCNGRGLKIQLDPVDPKPERDRERTPKVGQKAPVPAGTGPEAPAGEGRPRRKRGGKSTAVVPPETEVAEILTGDGAELPGVSDPVKQDEPATTPEAAADAVSEVLAELRAAPVLEEEPEAPVDLAEQPPTEAEDRPVLDAPATEPPVRRRRAAGRPAGAPTV
ncbi:MAG TPA: Rne/Rng family ribonuclease [Mycobacteriales bacterium]|nr:Rne/Rng family ribonuclease [Mycobacteriales bacterium]